MKPTPGRDKGTGSSGDDLPLLAAVDRYAGPSRGTPPLRMHVPGHKGGRGAPPGLLARWGRGIFADDLTEVPGLDDLADPAGAIARSQEATARRLGAAWAHYLVQGTSGGLAALLLAVARSRGGTGCVVLPRHSHRAVAAAVMLAGLDPVFVPVRFEGGQASGPDIGPLRAALEDGRRASAGGEALVAAVLDTYPSINGVAHDLAAVARACHSQGVPLLVDGAHAGLFGLAAALPAHPLALGADAVVISAHKTIGSLGQSSLLLVGNVCDAGGSASFAPELPSALRLVQTTSPSYPLLLSLEAAVEHATSRAGRAAVRRAAATGAAVCNALGRLGVRCWEPPPGSGLQRDPMRLTIDAVRLGRDGFAMARALRDEAGVQVEGADWRSVLVVFGPGDGPREGKRLLEAVAGLLRGRGIPRPAVECDVTRTDRISVLYRELLAEPAERAVPPRTAWLAGGEPVALHDAAGRVATEPLSPYPPGVPVVWPGEIISSGAVELVQEVLRMGGAVHGLVAACHDQDPRLVRVPVLRRAGG